MNGQLDVLFVTKKITTADPRIWSQCSSCKEYKSMHHNCLKTYLKVTDMIVPVDTTKEQYMQSAEFTCSQCLHASFVVLSMPSQNQE